MAFRERPGFQGGHRAPSPRLDDVDPDETEKAAQNRTICGVSMNRCRRILLEFPVQLAMRRFGLAIRCGAD